MFVPVVPTTTNKTKVVNKTIVYNDTVLKLDDLGENIKVTSISNITESNFEKCIKCILSSNEDVLFNTIQYSKKDKKIYFYTDIKIDTTKWDNKDIKEYEILENKKTLLNELDFLLNSENKPKDEDVIDLYSIITLYKKTEEANRKMIEIFTSRIRNRMRNLLNDSIYINHLKFNNDKKELELSYISELTEKTNTIVFSKKDNDVHIVRSNTNKANDIFTEISSIIREAFDELEKFEEEHNRYEYNYHLDVVNTNLKAYVSLLSTGLYRPKGKLDNDFELSFSHYFDTKHLKCNSGLIIDLVKNNEIKLFKNTFVKIEDCPKWMREILYETRKQELTEEKGGMKLKHKKRIKDFFNPFRR